MSHDARFTPWARALLALAGIACAASPPQPASPAPGALAHDRRPEHPAAVELAYHLIVTKETLRVELELQGPPRSSVRLGVMGSYGALHELELVRDLKAHDRRGAPVAVKTIEPHTWEPTVPQDGWLRVSYRVDVPERLFDKPGSGELPALDDHHVFIPGFLTLVGPSAAVAVEGPIPVSWTLPSGWFSVTAFGAEAPTLGSLLDSYLVAGDPSRDDFEVDGGLRIELAWFGPGSVPGSQLRTMLERSFAAAVGIIGGTAPTSRYLVIIRADAQGRFQGSPRRESIQLHVPAENEPDAVAEMRADGFPILARIVIHEYLHNWGREPADPQWEAVEPEQGGSMRWYYEGFVDYLAHRAMLDAGLVDRETFITGMRAYFERLQANPEYGQRSLVEASEAFFSRQSARRFAYLGGALVAMLCDVELRGQGRGGLEGFMARVPPGDEIDSLEVWLERWERYAGARDPVVGWVQGTQPLPIESYAQRFESLVTDG